jgi:hypothetical protein
MEIYEDFTPPFQENIKVIRAGLELSKALSLHPHFQNGRN